MSVNTIALNCDFCGKHFERRKASYDYDVKNGRKSFFCSPAHSNAAKTKPLPVHTCARCGESFSRKRSGSTDMFKYCSRTCSAVQISKDTAPKRRGKPNQCIDCGVDCARRKRCVNCTSVINPLSEMTLGELRERYSIHQYHAKIRGNARQAYSKSKKEKKCVVCEYSLHVDIAHIRSIADFQNDATISEVNHIGNLTALCKNHHWEFDNGYLSMLPSI